MSESQIWIEKYRPKCFDDVKGQEVIVSKVRAFVSQRNIPHLLFSGPAGVGKSTLALVIAVSLFGDSWKDNFIEFNASDERGIDVIRNKVKDFARTKSIGDVPFKIIFLDECDALTKEAQQALRRTMERYSSSCRFILAANYSSKIIDPIQSRCAVFRFKPLKREDMFSLASFVAKKENVDIDDSALSALVDVSSGDCRKMENILQSCAVLGSKIDVDLIYNLASFARPSELKDALVFAIEGDFVKARDFVLNIMLKYGLSGLDLVKQIQKIIWDLDIEDKFKVELIDKCGEIEFRIVEGADEFIQIEALLAHFILYKKS
jgi:replication factor C small subunit